MFETFSGAAHRLARTWSIASVLLVGCDAAGSGNDVEDAATGGAVHTEAGQTHGDPDDAAGSTADADASATTQSNASDAGGAGPPQKDAGGSSAQPASDAAASTNASCDGSGLVWKSAKKTNYESYPAPGSDECVKYHGCDYLGQFQACKNTMPESWVKSHDIASVFPLTDLELHKLCLRSGAKTFVVTAIDTCADSDCSGCCSQNRGAADRLIDLEKYTDQRFGVDDGDIEWADLGPADHVFDGCN